MADLSDAELATLHAIVEEQQAKWVVPKVKAKAAPTRASASASAIASVADAIVYVPATGAKFHSRSRCGNMRTAQPVTLACAEARGYTRCGSCW